MSTLRFCRFAALCALLLLMTVEQPGAISEGLVISQVYGGGGNSGAPYTHDFVEIHNRSASPISLSTLSIQYASAAGTGNLGANASQLAELPGVNLAPGGYFLVQLAGGATGVALPTPDYIDADGPINMSATGGKVVLVTGATTLGCNGGSTPCTPAQLARIIDLVGYGSASFSETAPTAAPGNTTAVVRTTGNVDTDNNSSDFVVAPPVPRNGGAAGNPTLSIDDAAISEGNDVATLRFTVTLNRAAAGDVIYSIATQDESATGGLDYQALLLSGQVIPAGSLTATHDVTIFGDVAPEPTETFAVFVSDVFGADPGDLIGRGTLVNDDIPFTPIHELQGVGDTSPFANTEVATRGIVTARKTNGFFIQTPNGEEDADPDTSNALFVFTSSAPAVAVGDEVRVSGQLVEFRSSSATTPGTLTEITGPSAEVLSSGNALPGAIDIAALLGTPAAFSNRIDQLERYESMLVMAASMDVVGPTNGFGEILAVMPGVSRPFREPGVDVDEPLPVEAPPGVPLFDSNLERLMLDSDELVDAAGARRPRLDLAAGAPGNPVQVRSVFGPLDYAFDNYRIALDTGAFGLGGRAPVPAPAASGAEFTVASLNLENFRDGTLDFDNRKLKAARVIAEVLRTPDILGLIEVGDLEDLQQLAALVNAAAGTTYQAYLEDGDGQATGSEQNIGYLVNDARVQVLGAHLEYQGKTFELEGEIDLLHDRPPFVLDARVRHTGTTVVAILNHLRSLIDVNSSEPFGSSGGTQGARVREKRRLQAEDLADLVTARAHENLIVLGDMNAFEFNDGLVDVIGTIKGDPAPPEQVTESSVDRWAHELVDLADLLPAPERYSYVFEGNAQVLDHVLVNQAMLARLTRFTYARNNADFPEGLESDFSVTTRLSDHDAAIAYFGPLTDLALSVSAASPVLAGGTLLLEVAATNTLDTASDVTISIVLPHGAMWQTTSAPVGWTCTTVSGTVSCSAATLEGGASATIEIVAAVGCGVADGTVLAVPAVIGSSTSDASSGDNDAGATATVSNPPPVITGAAASRTRLVLPLHQMVPVTLGYDAADACGPVKVGLTVTSDEPVKGPGQGLAGLTSPDWIVVDARRVWLRAERSPRGDGRVYTIAIAAVDAAGGVATDHVEVVVPR